MEYENNIVYDSYYLINKFKEKELPVTQLQVQKIMYFFEAYYMCEKDVPKLYECNFNAWAYGPVAIPLHKEYKAFEGQPIKLTQEKEDKGNLITEDKKEILDYIFKVFGSLSSSKLVELTHMKYSPWYNVWMENGQKVIYGSKSYIDKAETRKWFKEVFLIEEN